jgi:hypothetical protein
VFISHASEDKDTFVRPLATLLDQLGVRVWYDEFTLEVGDSLARSIDRGLTDSRFGVVVISPGFMSKPWPEVELRGLTAKELGRDKVILPVWHITTRDDVLAFSPTLADRLALDTTRDSLNEIALKITRVVRPDIYQNLLRLKEWEAFRRDARPEKRKLKDLKIAPIRHATLPRPVLVRIKILHYVLRDVGSSSLDSLIDNFRRDLHPLDELLIWERIAAAFLEADYEMGLTGEQRRDAFAVLLGASLGLIDDERARQFEHITYEQVARLLQLFINVVPTIVTEPDCSA